MTYKRYLILAAISEPQFWPEKMVIVSSHEKTFPIFELCQADLLFSLVFWGIKSLNLTEFIPEDQERNGRKEEEKE